MDTNPYEKTNMAAKSSPAKPALRSASKPSSTPNKPSSSPNKPYSSPNKPLNVASPAHLNSPQRRMASTGAKPMRYASYYGDGSGLPLRPGMGPPMTTKESQESWEKCKAEAKRIQNMSQAELHAKFPQLKDRKDCHFTEKEAWELLKENDEDEASSKRNINK
ncbi:hypothetical protein FNAPI_1391 [Fusarium napiforme]|uniref:Uncharacterized protein n=1 Tax=Fusarium napiforme TaxID=42672 RepID=A0A8H5K2U0_9HYPO|nr:hypothetical protein FNAPI_1391 [Fusarium napiforme]